MEVSLGRSSPVLPEIKNIKLPNIKNNFRCIPIKNESKPRSIPRVYSFDQKHFGMSPPDKNFMENLKLRMEKI